MKIKLAVMLALWCASASAQIVGGATPSLSSPGVGGGGMILVGQASAVPVSCSPDGVFFFKTTAPIGYLQCVGGSFNTIGGLTLTGISDNAVLKAFGNLVTASCMSDDGVNITTTGCGLIVGSSVAGQIALGQGTAGTCPATNVCLTVGTGPITAYQLVFPSAAASGAINWLNASNVLTGSFLSGTNGNVLSFGANNQLADAGFLASNVVRKETTNTAGSSMTLDMGAASVTAGLTVPKATGAAPTTDGVLSFDTTSHHLKVGSNGSTVDLQANTATIASGTSALATGAITSGTCATVVTTAATGTATTDNIMADFNADPTGVTGYAPSASGMLTIIKYPTSNNVNFKVCNNTGGSITPGAITLNWRVVR